MATSLRKIQDTEMRIRSTTNRNCFKLFLFSTFLMMPFCRPAFGQVSDKKTVTADDYCLWGTIMSQDISAAGNWASYVVRYGSGEDTLFVHGIRSKTKYFFEKGVSGKFDGERRYVCKTGDSLTVQNLITGKRTVYHNVNNYDFSHDGRFLLVFFKALDSLERLAVYNSDGGLADEIPNIVNWKLDAYGNNLAYCSLEGGSYNARLLHLKNNAVEKTLITTQDAVLQEFLWSGTALSFFAVAGQKNKLFFYTTEDTRLYTLDPRQHPDFPNQYLIAPTGTPPDIVGEGKSIAFKIRKKNFVASGDPDEVQVWHANDKKIWPERIEYGNTLEDQILLWAPANGSLQQLTSGTRNQLILDAHGNFALTWDASQYEPQSDYQSPADFYIRNIHTGQDKLLLQKHSAAIGSIVVSPGGRYVRYYKAGSIFLYDVKTERHTEISKGFAQPLFTEDHDRPDALPVYASPSWTLNDRSLLVQDYFDLWEISPDGSKRKRLTHGREKGISYRLVQTAARQQRFASWEQAGEAYDISNTVVLLGKNEENGDGGYFFWSHKSGERPFAYGASLSRNIVKAREAQIYLFSQESFENPPMLIVANDKTLKSELLVQSNVHYLNYNWGKSELISYHVNGKPAKGALFYPAGYVAGKRYPMIVEIYEKLSGSLHQYVNPTWDNGVGTNTSNFNSNGYFVLFPDILYELGEIGPSAVRSVLAATDAVVKKGVVDAAKIGLTGHSFGGYETNFIITQTDRFATAVSGSAINDIVSSYFYVSGTTNRPDYYRYEFDQQRMGKSFFEDPNVYLRNAPLMHADKIETPLLSFTGGNDLHVHYFQSTEFYLALRRLNKKHTMLVYPGAMHVLSTPEQKRDLTEKVQQWFDFYLKGSLAPNWMDGVETSEKKELSP